MTVAVLVDALQRPITRAARREAWAQRRSVRVPAVLTEASAHAIQGALRQQPHHAVSAPPDRFGFQYWKHTWTPQTAASPALAAFAHWLHRDFVEWIAAWTGQNLSPHPSLEVTATLFGYGCYLDVHNDWGYDRALAFVFGLTATDWPAAEGGHLEFLQADNEAASVVERRPPGWNTVDVFDVSGRNAFHRIPILTAARERRVISGWLYRPT